MSARLTAFAKTLRQESSDAERTLWRYIRAHRFDGRKFKRQEVIGSYIVDFVCHEAKLVIELDGGQHAEKATDTQRDAWLAAQGFTVPRFWNNDVLTNMEGVLERMREYLAPSPQPSPTRGEGDHCHASPANGKSRHG